MATKTHEATIEVDVPIRTAYDQWTQFEEFPKFMDGVDRVTHVTGVEPDLAEGSGGVVAQVAGHEVDVLLGDEREAGEVEWEAETSAPLDGSDASADARLPTPAAPRVLRPRV